MASVAALKGDVKMGHERDEEGKALQKPKWDWILDRNKGRSSTLEVQRVAKCATHLADLVDVRMMVLAVGWAAANGDSFCVRKVRMDGEEERTLQWRTTPPPRLSYSVLSSAKIFYTDAAPAIEAFHTIWS